MRRRNGLPNSPQNFYRFGNLASAHFVQQDYGACIEAARQGLFINGEFFLNHLLLIAAFVLSNEMGKAEAAIAALQKAYNQPTVSEFGFLPFADRTVTDRLLESLRKAGLPE